MGWEIIAMQNLVSETSCRCKSLAKDMAHYFLWCIEKFGTKRCMFENNFQVDRISYSYCYLECLVKRFAKDFSLGAWVTTPTTQLFRCNC